MTELTDHVGALLREVRQQDGQVTADLTVPADSALVRGHFPGRPVLPGFAWLEVLRVLVEQCRPEPWRLLKVLSAKMTRPMEPGQTGKVTLTLQSQGGNMVCRMVVMVGAQRAAEVEAVLST